MDAEKLIVTLKNALEIKTSRMEVKKLQVKQRQLHEDIDRQFKLFRVLQKMERYKRYIRLLGQCQYPDP
jgi:hypothetical protein